LRDAKQEAQVPYRIHRPERRWRGSIRARGARAHSIVLTWIAALVIGLQLASAPFHGAIVKPAEAVGAFGALSALLGPHVALCRHDDGSAPGSPAHDPHDCCDDCAVCAHKGTSAALLPPSHAVPARLARPAKPLSGHSERNVVTAPPVAFAQARAPPIFA
jgi:hypothetical protein